MNKLIRRVASLTCIFRGGHDRLIRREHGRMSLECVHCGDQTAGWDPSIRPVDRPNQPPATARRTVQN